MVRGPGMVVLSDEIGIGYVGIHSEHINNIAIQLKKTTGQIEFTQTVNNMIGDIYWVSKDRIVSSSVNMSGSSEFKAYGICRAAEEFESRTIEQEDECGCCVCCEPCCKSCCTGCKETSCVQSCLNICPGCCCCCPRSVESIVKQVSKGRRWRDAKGLPPQQT